MNADTYLGKCELTIGDITIPVYGVEARVRQHMLDVTSFQGPEMSVAGLRRTLLRVTCVAEPNIHRALLTQGKTAIRLHRRDSHVSLVSTGRVITIIDYTGLVRVGRGIECTIEIECD